MQAAGAAFVLAASLLTSATVAAGETGGLTASTATGTTRDWSGRPVSTTVGQVLASVMHRVRVGGEFEYSQHRTDLLGRSEIDVDAYRLRGVVQLIAFPNRLSPYVGIGIGIDVMRYLDGRLPAEHSTAHVDRFGLGAGGVGLVGLQLPLAHDLQLFGEARGGLSWDLMADSSVEMGREQLGGWSSLAGVRLRF